MPRIPYRNEADPQIAELVGVTPRTLNRDWRFARAFLSGSLG